jgi:hypothetical protein
MEPRPLLEEDATEVETALLCAGRGDGPRREVAARALAMIEGLVPEPPLDASSAASAAFVKWAKIALVTVGLGGAAVVAYHFTRPHAAPPPTLPSVPQTAPAAAPVQAPVPAPVPQPQNGGEAFAAAPEQEPMRARRRGVANRARNESASSLDSSLGQETLLLDRARKDLDAQEGGEALRVLDQYERQFPHGLLRPEATLLRLAALFQTGKIAAADSLAARLLADEAYSAYVPRIRSLAREANR